MPAGQQMVGFGKLNISVATMEIELFGVRSQRAPFQYPSGGHDGTLVSHQFNELRILCHVVSDFGPKQQTFAVCYRGQRRRRQRPRASDKSGGGQSSGSAGKELPPSEDAIMECRSHGYRKRGLARPAAK